MAKLARAIPTLFLLIILTVTQATSGATITIDDQTHTTENGTLLMVSNQTWTSSIHIVGSNGEPFSLSNIPGATLVNVTARFVDDAGNTLDMTGDGIPDVWTYVPDNSTLGLYHANITIGDVEPGIYTLKITAVALNNSSEVLDHAELEKQVYILGGHYFLEIANVDDGQTLNLGHLNIHIDALSALGGIISINNLSDTRTIQDTNHDGMWSTRIDLNNDGIPESWLTLVKTKDGYSMIIFTNNASLLPKMSRTFSIQGNTITFKNRILRDRDRFYVYIAWDNSLLAKLGIKAVDYYIVPSRKCEDWKYEGPWQGTVMKVKVIKRTTYFFVFTKEEVVYEGNIWRKKTDIDNTITLYGRAIMDIPAPSSCSGVQFIVGKGLVDITIPVNYQLKMRTLSATALDFRGDNPLNGLNWLSRQLSTDKIDWWKLLGGDEK